jgi:hypothetical protein
MEGVGNALYTKSTNKLGYIKSVYSGMYARSRNKVVYIEFTGCRYSVLLITEYRSVYIPSKIDIG